MVVKEKTIKLKCSRVFHDVVKSWTERYRRCLLEGGTSSTKTYSALQFLLYLAEVSKVPLTISIVSESLPHLKKGCIRDFFNIIQEPQDNNPYFSKTDFRYKRPGWVSYIEFFGADDAGKVLGSRRNILFINEGNNIPWETARHMDSRTDTFTIVDWNPAGEFWAHEYWMDEESTFYSHSSYEDALEIGVISEQFVKDNILIYKDKDPNWWNVYGLGLLGKIEGLVYPNFDLVEELPLGACIYGLDFGFTNDPSVLTKHVIIGDKLYSHECFYEYGLTNEQIARKMDLLGVGRDVIYADSAEPKSIEEIRMKGFNIQPCEKGAGSVEYGIQKVNQFYQYWTKDSTNCIKEQRNFRYIKDRVTGELTDRTTHLYSHGMDSRRYALSTYRGSAMFLSTPVSNVTGRAIRRDRKKTLLRW